MPTYRDPTKQEAEISLLEEITPSARKSFGQFKPMLKHPNGGTTIVGQARNAQWTRERGVLFSTREGAIGYAAATKVAMIEDATERLECLFYAHNREHGLTA